MSSRLNELQSILKMNKISNVTVIIPCYNDGKYIEEALQSVYNQTLLPEKIIVIDDGSDMATKKVLAALNHPLLQIVHQENKGVSVARNTAIALAKTDYIVNLDADDYYDPTFIEKSVDILYRNTNLIAVTSYYRVFKGSTTKEIRKPLGGKVRDFIVINNCVANTLFRKSAWKQGGGFDVKMQNGYEDWEFWISTLKNGHSIHVIHEVLSHYRIKKASRDQTALMNYDLELRKYIYNKHKELYNEHIEFYVDELLRQNSLLRTTIKNKKESKEWRLGESILAPFRYFKKQLFK